MKIKESKGFTLIELLIVIAIIVILTTIIYSSFGQAQSGARDKKRVSDISSIQLSLEQYFNHFGQYPTTTTALIPSYIATVPNPPSGSLVGIGYGYNYIPLTEVPNSSVCSSYQLWTTLEGTSSYLSAKKGFNSLGLSNGVSNGSGFYTCGRTDYSLSPVGLNIETNASANSFIYDVMPQ